MEKKADNTDRHIPRDRPLITPEELAINALVNELYKRSDARVVFILNQQCEGNT